MNLIKSIKTPIAVLATMFLLEVKKEKKVEPPFIEVNKISFSNTQYRGQMSELNQKNMCQQCS